MKRALLVVLLLGLGLLWAVPGWAQGSHVPGVVAPEHSLLGKGRTLDPRCTQYIREHCQSPVCFTPESNYMSSLGRLRLQEFQRTGEWLSHEEAIKLCRQKNEVH